MVVRSLAKPKPSKNSESYFQKLYKNPKVSFACALLLADAILVGLIIAFVPYTKIDWDAYMSQVDGFLEGERDYSNLKGDTGPLVYPAGFLYIYSAIQFITGGQVYPAQVLFAFLYIVNLGFVLFVYVKTDVKWHLGLIIFSAAVSVKMNVLLYAPPLLLLMVKAMDISGVISALASAAIVQILLGLPFLLEYPISYISGAFNLGRVFIHFWSVNFKFVPEPAFVSKEFAVSLLVAHLILLTLFAHYRWCKHEGGLLSFLQSRYGPKQLKDAVSSSFYNSSSGYALLKNEHIITTMFVGNFIGIVCARSLHYQFYSWYFCSLPYLLWKTSYPTWLCIILFAGVEYCWNVFPSTTYSSMLLLGLHLVILWGLWSAPPEYPYVNGKSSRRTKGE